MADKKRQEDESIEEEKGKKGGRSGYKQKMDKLNKDIWDKEMTYVDINDY